MQIEGRLKQSFSDGLETVKIINVETIFSNYDKPNNIFNTYAMIHFLSQNISSKQATAIGLLAVALWSFVISLIRSLSLHMGGSGRRGNDVHPVYRIDLADFRPAAFA